MDASYVFRWLLLAVGVLGCRASSAADSRSQRLQMVREQIEGRGVHDAGVLAAMRKVPRHRFVPAAAVAKAYGDRPLHIGHDQTISQPYIVAAMSEALRLTGKEKVLEIGTGSGYQAAVLAELAREVYTIEIVEPLARSADRRLSRLGYGRVHVRAGDGYKGWPEAAPFDAIILTAAPEKLPEPLVEQLRVGGRMVFPEGPAGKQELFLLTKTKAGVRRERLMSVRFVPMTGQAEKREKK